MPRMDNSVNQIVLPCVNKVPGCITHARIDISAILIPLEFLINALLLSTWPRKATKTVTKDNSIDLAMTAQSKDASAGVSVPFKEIFLPYRGFRMASTSQVPENIVEYISKMNMEIFIQSRQP